MHRQTHEHPDSSPKAARRVLMLLAFVVTKENNSKEVNTAREGDSRGVRPEIFVFYHKEDIWGVGSKIRDQRSQVEAGS